MEVALCVLAVTVSYCLTLTWRRAGRLERRVGALENALRQATVARAAGGRDAAIELAAAVRRAETGRRGRA